MPQLVTLLTPISAKDINALMPSKSMRWAERQLTEIRKELGKCKTVVVRHLVAFWSVEEDDILTPMRKQYAI
jgi:hypothetical protein